MTQHPSRIRDVVQGLVAWTVLAIVVVGIPVLLARGVGWPLWRAVPDLSRAGSLLDRGLPERVFLNAVACLAWFVWVQFSVATFLEVVASIRGRRAAAVPLLAHPVQQSAAHLVALSMLVFAALSMRPPAAPGPLPPRDAVVSPNDLAAARPAADAARPVAVVDTDIERNWSVQRRDTLWKIAEHTLGDGNRYHEIFELNRNRPQGDGSTLRSATDRLQAGWNLRLPPDAVVAAPGEAHVESRDWTVRPGDTLGSIAHRTLGSPSRWTDLFDANRGRTQADGGVLVDPDVLEPGWVLVVPAAPAGVEVVAGDTLSSIAADRLGDAERWPELFEANEGSPQPDGGVLVDPDVIEIGWELDLPVAASEEIEIEASQSPVGLDAIVSGGISGVGVGETAQPPTPIVDLAPVDLAPVDLAPRDVDPPDAAVDLAPIDLAPVDEVGDLDPVDLDAEDANSTETAVDARPFPVLPLAGAASAGLVVLAGRLQSMQRRRRRLGERPSPVDPRTAMLSSELRSVASLDAPDTVDRALRTLSHDLDVVPARLGIRCLVIRGDLVGVVLDRPLAAPPPGWIMDGNTLLLDKSIDQDLLDALGAPSGRRASSIAPALVAVGVDAHGIGEIFFDLESTGVLGLAGPDEAIEAVHRWLVWAVLSAPWADGVDVVLAGRATPVDVPWVRAVATLEEAVMIAEERVASIGAALDAVGVRGTTSARMVDPDGPWRPVIVIADHVPAFDSSLAARLNDLDRQGIGAAVLLPGMLAGVPTAVVTGDVVEFPGGISARTPRLDAEHDRAIGAFLRPLRFEAADTPPPFIGQTVSADATVAVRVLGDVEVRVDDTPVTFAEPLALELVTWLALHQSAGEIVRIRRELGDPDEATWAASLGEVRRLLPVEESGSGVLGLRRTNTDVDVFRRLVAPTARGEVSVDRLDEALRLVRGPILDGPTHRPGWADRAAEYLMCEIADAAERVARRHLSEGAALAAGRVARRALRACPDAEILHLLVIESTVAAGGDDVEAAIDTLYESLASAGGSTLGLPADTTLARIGELRQRHRDLAVIDESAG